MSSTWYIVDVWLVFIKERKSRRKWGRERYRDRGLKRQRREVNVWTEKSEENKIRAKIVCLEKRQKYVGLLVLTTPIRELICTVRNGEPI